MICSICFKSKLIRGLLCDGVVAQNFCTCPLCDSSMAPNMAIAVRKFTATKNSDNTEGDIDLHIKEKINPFSMYYHKTLELGNFGYSTGLSHAILNAESKAVLQRCNTLLSSIEDMVANKLSSVGTMEFIVEIYCLVRRCL